MFRVLLLVVLGSGFVLPVQRLGANDAWDAADTHVVIIGVTRWKADLTSYPRRRRKDKELRELLIQRGTPPKQISVLLDSEATLENIRQTIRSTLLATNANSTLLIYFAGHGWRIGDDFCFANYDVTLGPDNAKTGWTVRELANDVYTNFNGRQAIFIADCCHSGGLRLAVEKLQLKGISSFSLTSATEEITSTGNWTFTQLIIDALAGSPLMDTNRDGMISLGEVRLEINNAMLHLEGQKSGFYSSDTDDDFVFGSTTGEVIDQPELTFPLGSYVRVKGRYGRIVDASNTAPTRYSVEFFNYASKEVRRYAESELRLSRRGTGELPGYKGLYKVIGGKAPSIWRDQIGHIHPGLESLEGYVFYATVYGKSPELISKPIKFKEDPTLPSAALDKIFREIAWKAVVEHPLSGVTDENKNGVGDHLE